MRALVLPATTGPDGAGLADVPEPDGAHPWADGERLLVDVRAAAVSFPDVLQSRGRYQHGAPAPYVVGGEYAGTVLEAPAGSRFRPGDRVAGFTCWGAIAERTLAIPRHTVRIPDAMSWVEGAAFYLNYVTAWFTLHRAGFRDGESVLVHGAAGGVGTATLDLLRGRAKPVVAVVSSERKAEVARGCGADEVVPAGGDWLGEVRELTHGLGVDVVVDPVGGDRFTDSLRALDVGGRLMVVGFADGAIPEVKVNRLLLRDLTVMGVALEPWQQRFAGFADELTDALEQAATRVSPYVGTVLPLERAHEAMGILDRREALGKVVVEVASDR
ncbi:NADPH:quinone oxidoreductase family protein [Nocardioides mangrovi]|uniref:NADPH:quinone oxidoreductase family protein n=1 Tax=Nocardioides mangrovi TaxID=2874580 RepID=A0ABS7UC64_9ACTN|nr:NADPH:quinone oxidoreductase family protein [Nocardioides mangrovi]MBZ5738377.1 NADPH:quinone oxidoreductase family protein [Nocardioides mangrovi]